jgi:acyl carrier protein
MLQIRELIFTACDLGDVDRNILGPHDPLFGPDSPLQLDSVDSLEIIVAMQRDFGDNVRIADRNAAIVIFKDLATLTDFVEQNRDR